MFLSGRFSQFRRCGASFTVFVIYGSDKVTYPVWAAEVAKLQSEKAGNISRQKKYFGVLKRSESGNITPTQMRCKALPEQNI